MKISIPCMECSLSQATQTGATANIPLYEMDVQEDGLYRLTCSNGHLSRVYLTSEKFELLFDIGLNAIVDGYYRDAVSSITAALERFYEYFVKVYAASIGIDAEAYSSSWREIKNQSERQLGAFIFSYLHWTRSKPVLLSNRFVEFRNAVIHKGKIPSKTEAIEYANVVLNLINPIVLKMKEELSETMRAIQHREFRDFTQALPASDARFASMTMVGAISMALAVSERHAMTIDERLRRIELNRVVRRLG